MGFFKWFKKKKENATQISKTYTYEVRISRKGRKAVYKGIYDSVNLLVIHITGQGVCIIQKEQAAKLLLTKEKSEIEQIYIQFSEEKEEKKREKNGKKKEKNFTNLYWSRLYYCADSSGSRDPRSEAVYSRKCRYKKGN